MQDDIKLSTAEAGAIGGKARAKNLTATKRREIAKKAAAARWDGQILKVTHGDTDHPLKIGEAEIACYVLEDGQRVLSMGGVIRSVGMAKGGASRREGDRLLNFVSGKAIKPFVSEDLLTRMRTPIRFQAPTGGSLAFGYEATILPDLCDAVLAARKAGALHFSQVHIADQCEILVRGFARVGIIALVDEATGFQDARAKNALAEILEAFVQKELRKWVSTFPTDYYREMFRLWGWTFPNLPKDQQKRPLMAGKITNDLIYARLAPGVRKALHDLTPRDAKGRLRNKLFQRLTEDVGHPKLREHLARVVTVMQLAPDRRVLMDNMNRLMPKYKDLPLFDALEEQDIQ